MKFAFTGFRHGHINSMYTAVKNSSELSIVAASESDEETYQELVSNGKIEITHRDFDKVLKNIDCDIVAVGDYYAKRGEIIIKALNAGKHVIVDKPVCTSLDELNEIARLTKRKNLKLGCMLDLRDNAIYLGAQKILKKEKIGEISAISFNGQHQLNFGSRPMWYFEKGKHGGTINDIAIHGIDFITWATGLEFKTVNSARCWNSVPKDYPFFKDGAQLMMTMNNGCGVLGDVSYFAPDKLKFSLPQNWRFTFWGTEGVLEVSAAGIQLAQKGEEKMIVPELPQATPGNYLQNFIDEINGVYKTGGICTESVIKSTRACLTAQKTADENLFSVKI